MNSTKEGQEREKLRKEAIETLRNYRGVIRDTSGLLKPDDPELKDIEGVRVDRDGVVYKVSPNLGRPPILDPEEAAKRKRAWFSKCRPHAVKALELYQLQNQGTCFELDEVKCTEQLSDGSRCFTMDSLISEPDPDFEIVKSVDYGAWVVYPYGCTLCKSEQGKPVKSSSVPSKSKESAQPVEALGFLQSTSSVFVPINVGLGYKLWCWLCRADIAAHHRMRWSEYVSVSAGTYLKGITQLSYTSHAPIPTPQSMETAQACCTIQASALFT
ncbi:hypothetical protein Tsubulata_004776 [Turnera subulata]|uniref:Uncharacterized protein n=1 Tax=Turnera subulata TaxID=218843 RepID=A0A9Q0FBX6_9ROSI|nr:hypothetical protein Tsubulata_004776 [Turnera subulata]